MQPKHFAIKALIAALIVIAFAACKNAAEILFPDEPLSYSATAQDTTITLTPSMGIPPWNEIKMGKIDGWIFKEGNDT